MVAHAYNPSQHSEGRGRQISELEASLVYRGQDVTGQDVLVSGHPGLHRETLPQKTKNK